MTILEQIAEYNDFTNAKKQALVERLKVEFPQMLAPLFARSKRIDSVSWTQYTPYYNDGDPCTFQAHVSNVNINEEDKYEMDWYTWKIKYFLEDGRFADEVKGADIEECKIVFDIEKTLNGIPDEFYNELFGDGVKVTVHRSGEIAVEDYDHD